MAKILIVGSAHPLRGGGLATFNERLARAFREEGHEVEILTFSLQYPSFLFPGTTQYSDEPAPQDLKITVGLNSVNPLSWLWQGYTFRAQQFDYVIIRYWLPFMSPCLGTVARVLGWGTKARIVAITDNVIPHEKRFGDTILTKYFVASCDAFVAMSQAVMKELQDFAPNKPKKLNLHPLYDNFGTPPPRNEALARLNLPENNRYVLFFGFIRAYKGLDIALKAFAHKKLKDSNIKLIVAGEFYENAEPYLQIIKENGLENNIILATNFIPNDAVATYFAVADLLVQPYRSATQSGVSQVAYHFEKPMIVTNTGGLAEMIPDQKAGYIVEPEPISVAEAILDYFDSPQKQQNFKAFLKEEKKKFSWKKMVETLLSV